ncbi:MAG: hypothetical protein Crog4KO_26010 [Crocinitomicaceae bacterium]
MSDLSNKASKKRQSSPDLLDDQLIVQREEAKKSQKTGWYSNLNPTQKSIVSWTGIGVGVSLIAALGIIGIRKVYREQRSKKEESKSFGTNKHATWAKQIYKSLKLDTWTGLGTDEVLLRSTLRSMETIEDWNKTVTAYKKIYKGRSMTKDISGDLSTTEFNEMIAIIKAKPKTAKDKHKPNRELLKVNWARRIYAAINYSTWGFMAGTDEDAVKAVFMDFQAQSDYWGTKRQYYAIYGANMFKALKADMDDIHDYLKIVWRKPKTIKTDV